MSGKPKYTDPLCAIEGCGKPRAKGVPWCSTHRAHRYRWGHPTEKLINLRAKDPNVLCNVDGCGKVARHGSPMCEMHYARVRRHGDTETVWPSFGPANARQSNPTYLAVHKRIYRDRGKASALLCVDCGTQADQWSYDHSDPAERTELVIARWPDKTAMVRFSEDTSRYVPRCFSCHVTFDKRP